MQKQFRVMLTGVNSLLIHNDNLEWAEGMARWLQHPDNKAKSVAGDDRFPAWRWLGCCYHDNKYIGIPSDNLMTAIREGAAKVSIPGKRGATFKRQSQSGILVNEILWPLRTKAGLILWPEIAQLRNEEDFSSRLTAEEVEQAEHIVRVIRASEHAARAEARRLKGPNLPAPVAEL